MPLNNDILYIMPLCPFILVVISLENNPQGMAYQLT